MLTALVLAIFFTVIGGGRTLGEEAGSEWLAAPSQADAVEPSCGCLSSSSGVVAYAEWLNWQAHRGGLDFASFVDPVWLTPGTVESLDYDRDNGLRVGLGFRFANMGVVEFIDFGGNDILYHASRYLAQALDDERYASPEIVARHMREGRNGLRDGRGFHDFGDVDVAAWRREALGRMLQALKRQGLMRPPDPG